MPKRIALSELNGSTLDILNVIRQNASYDYQQNVPQVTKSSEIPKVGEIICGTPAFSNQFVNALVNRIALVRVNSMTFNNPYARLKKGYLEFGETVEEIFVAMAKAVDYTPEKALAREFKRTIPDVKSAFHTMNWRVMYPVTIQDEDLRMAFLSIDGVTNLIADIVEQVYTAAETDEFLLFKYMLIKAISSGAMKPVSIGNGVQLTDSAVQFRGVSNLLQFPSSEYTEAGVMNVTPKDRQIIFMDAMFNAQYDVNVLASAFNMDKATFSGSLFLIDKWTSFDNERFEIIRDNSDGIEEVTNEELQLLANVKAVLIDERWFQVYDNLNKFTEQYVASGLYWNYFYHTWKTISHSPFSNAVVFVTDGATVEAPAQFTVHVSGKSEGEEATILTLESVFENTGLASTNVRFIQTDALTRAGIGVQPYGGLLIPASQVTAGTSIKLEAMIGEVKYEASAVIDASVGVDSTVTMTQA